MSQSEPMATQLFCPCNQRNESFLASWLWSYMYSGYCCSIKLQDPQQLVDFSLKFSYVTSTRRKKKCPIKILGGLILRVYIPIYPRRYGPEHGGVDLMGLKPNPWNLSSFSALTLLVGSFDL